MEQNFLVSLIQNVTILLSFSMMYDYFWVRKRNKINTLHLIVTGIFLAGVGYLLIRTPWTMMDGMIFDSRTILLSTAGLFLGPVPTLIAMAILTAYRSLIGGEGIWMGIATIISSGLIGIFWKQLRPNWNKNPLLELAALGITVHVFMMCCTLLLPASIREYTFHNIIYQVLIIYPISNVLLGLLMLRQHKNRNNKEDLATSEERWRFAIEGSGDGLWDWDVNSKNVYFSPQLKKMLGFGNHEMPGLLSEWEEKLHPNDYDKAMQDALDFINGKTDMLDSEYRMKTKSGDYIWIQDRGMAMHRDENGKAIRCIGTFRDITQRKTTEQELLDSQKYTNSILTAIPDLIFVMNSEGIYLDFKSGNKEDLYLSPETFINKKMSDLMPLEVSNQILDGIKRVLTTNKNITIEYDLIIDNQNKNFECNVLPFATEKVIVMVRNISNRKKIELQLIQSQSELKRFAAHLQNIRENERISLAREIHDELGQILVAVKMELGMLMRKNQTQTTDKSEAMNKNFVYLQSLVDQTIKTARKIMTDLRPEVLDMLGVVDAIRQHTHKFENHYHIKTIFNTETEQLNLPREQSVALFRITQEALNNIVKHAQATLVNVNIGVSDNGFYLEINDNGNGFDINSPKNCDSYGMLGMRERAYLINGNLQIDSIPGEGTTIRIECINHEKNLQQ